MARLLLAVVLAATLSAAGCAAQQPLLPSGEDPTALAEAIARKAHDGEPSAPAASPTTADRAVQVTLLGALYAVCVPVAIAPYLLKALAESHAGGRAG
jgi:hypothetical protein